MSETNLEMRYSGPTILSTFLGRLMHQSRVLTEMNEETLYLWFAYPEDLLTQATEEACFSLLSEQERASSREFKFEHHRREYLTTRALVRTALSQYNPLTPEAWRFKLNSYGRPATDPQCGLMFNLSNCPGLVVCLIAKGIDVGVDAEPDERAEKIEEVASRVFSPAELAQLETLARPREIGPCLVTVDFEGSVCQSKGKGTLTELRQALISVWCRGRHSPEARPLPGG